MNIFYLDESPKVSAQLMTDKHIVKMILESAQMLSTAHRVLDGYPITSYSETGRRTQSYEHPRLNDVLYKSAYVNHPSTKWVRESIENYNWLYQHFYELNVQYQQRFNRTHKTFERLNKVLIVPPYHIPQIEQTEIPRAMPDKYKDICPIVSYRNYYANEKIKTQEDYDRYRFILKKNININV